MLKTDREQLDRLTNRMDPFFPESPLPMVLQLRTFSAHSAVASSA
jgi:hypothetical protein